MRRSRNLFLAASAGPLEPSGVFFMRDQLMLMASHISIMYWGMGPSNVMYHRAGVRNDWKRGGGVLVMGISGASLNGGGADEKLAVGSSVEDELGPDLLS